ncbi:MAG: hypothetical protein CMC81_02715 [Flavobacteriaceae bacterium]|nr:hypothetical protein [Flavobacteriaceae bacterium]|tara:strand:+ start:2601 stop:2975 length:375 start_codon:yes stop_codon:yes gene_type:complete
MKYLIIKFSVLLFLGCEPYSTKKEFSLEKHLKSNKWCTFIKKNQSCITFTNNEMNYELNGVAQTSFKVSFREKSDSIIIIKVVGALNESPEQGIENQFRMKSLDTFYFSQGDEDKMLQKFTRIK